MVFWLCFSALQPCLYEPPEVILLTSLPPHPHPLWDHDPRKTVPEVAHEMAPAGGRGRLQSLGSRQGLKPTSLPFLFTYTVSKAVFVLGEVGKKNKWWENIELTGAQQLKHYMFSRSALALNLLESSFFPPRFLLLSEFSFSSISLYLLLAQ